MEWLSGFLDQIIAFFQFIWDFLTHGIYDFVKEAMVLLTKGAIYSFIQMQIFALDVAYSTAQSLLSDLGVSQAVREKYGALPSDIVNGLNYFGIPQALNIVFSALSTRFVLRFVPFVGR